MWFLWGGVNGRGVGKVFITRSDEACSLVHPALELR